MIFSSIIQEAAARRAPTHAYVWHMFIEERRTTRGRGPFLGGLSFGRRGAAEGDKFEFTRGGIFMPSGGTTAARWWSLGL